MKNNDAIEIRDQSGDPFTAVWNWLLDRLDLSGTEKLVWIALKSYAGCREIRPSVQSVARRAGVSIRTAQRSITTLSEKGLLQVERRSRPDGGFATNRYILLPSPPPQRKTRSKDRCHRVACPPGVMMASAPGDIPAPPQAPQWHHKENIKQIKDNTTTPRTHLEKATYSELPQSATAVVVDDIRKLAADTPFRGIDERTMEKFADKYGHKYVLDSLDVLIATYRASEKPVKNPVAVLASGLLKGVIPPSDFVPYHERIENERKAKEAAKLNQRADAEERKAEEKAYSEKISLFDDLPPQKREEWLERAKTELPTALRGSKNAVRSRAIELFLGG